MLCFTSPAPREGGPPMSPSCEPTADSLALALEVDSLCDRFETALCRGAATGLGGWLPAPGPLRAAALPQLARVELEHRLRAGQPASAEEYLARYPELASDPGAAEMLRHAQRRFGQGLPAA